MKEHILIIEDDESFCKALTLMLEKEGYLVASASDGHQAIEAAKKTFFDVIVADVKLPGGMDGIEAVAKIKGIRPEVESIVIIITGYADEQAPVRALRLGVDDYIYKPFKREQFLHSVERSLRIYRLEKEKEKHNQIIGKMNQELEDKVEQRTRDLSNLYEELQATYLRTVKALAQAIDARDHYTHSHSVNVTRYAVIIAQEMNLSAEEVDEIRQACGLHDLGKIGIHDYVLTKPGKLTAQEWEEVRLHSLKGAEILEPLTFLKGAIKLIQQHHERYDGKGYPYGIKGETINLGARIMAVADAFDAMISERPYREKPLTKQEAIEEIKENSGTQFDPQVVQTFFEITDKL